MIDYQKRCEELTKERDQCLAIATKNRATADRYRKALEQISSIENKSYGGDWEEIDEARAIANKALL